MSLDYLPYVLFYSVMPDKLGTFKIYLCFTVSVLVGTLLKRITLVPLFLHLFHIVKGTKKSKIKNYKTYFSKALLHHLFVISGSCFTFWILKEFRTALCQRRASPSPPLHCTSAQFDCFLCATDHHHPCDTNPYSF